MRVEGGEVRDLRYRCGPVALQVADAALDVRLLLRPAHQAEPRRERIVTGQRLVAVVEPALPADEHLRRHRARVVPPEFVRHTAEEGEGFDQAVQDRLGALARQSQGEGAIGVAPGHQQHGDLPATVGKVDVDVAEVGFEPLAGVVVERDKRLALR